MLFFNKFFLIIFFFQLFHFLCNLILEEFKERLKLANYFDFIFTISQDVIDPDVLIHLHQGCNCFVKKLRLNLLRRCFIDFLLSIMTILRILLLLCQGFFMTENVDLLHDEYVLDTLDLEYCQVFDVWVQLGSMQSERL